MKNPTLTWAAISLSALLLPMLDSGVRPDDWPTYQHDATRSGTTGESLPLPLAAAWTWTAREAPEPAWDEPARWDGWNKIHDLRNRVDFDKVFHVAVVGDAVYFGSSIDDRIRCLDANEGTTRWSFATEAPVRLAPTVADGQLFCGSDDGSLYSLDAASGALRWRQRVAPRDQWLAGNGRLISLWPVRGGPVVYEDVVYCGAGVFPSETVYVGAFRTSDGEPLWRQEVRDVPVQGYLLASPSRLYLPTGRGAPLVFERTSGRRLHALDGSGGTYALVTGDAVYTTAGRDGRSIGLHASGSKEQLARFPGNHMIVTPELSFLHTDTYLAALDRKRYVDAYAARTALRQRAEKLEEEIKKRQQAGAQGSDLRASRGELGKLVASIEEKTEELRRAYRWQVETDHPFSLVLAGEHVVAGGNGRVSAFATTDGAVAWTAPVAGKAYGLAVASGRLFVSTDAGTIHSFTTKTSGDGESRFRLSSPTERSSSTASGPSAEAPAADEPSVTYRVGGPFVECARDGSAVVSWTTDEALPCALVFDAEAPIDSEVLVTPATTPPGRRHRATLENLDRDRRYGFRIRLGSGEARWTPLFRFDPALDYGARRAERQRESSDTESAATKSPSSRWAERISSSLASRRGYALVLGADDGALIRGLAAAPGSELQLVVVEPDGERARSLRDKLASEGFSGHRATVHHRALDDLPYRPFFANVITSEAIFSGSFPPPSKLLRWLRPAGGSVHLGVAGGRAHAQRRRELADWIRAAGLNPEDGSWTEEGADAFWTFRRGALEGAGEWTHQYGSATNASFAGDDLVRGPLDVLWFGRPGPRPMPDRGPRNPAPLFAGGRLFVQGDRIFFALDAYNGTILWSFQAPGIRRANLPRDSSNMAASAEYLYVADGSRCWGVRADDGQRELELSLPEEDLRSRSRFWSFVSVVGDLLIGSSSAAGAGYLGDDGEWYEGDADEEIGKVVSRSLFARDRRSGELRWRYARSAVINSTISSDEEKLYAVAFPPNDPGPPSGRLPGDPPPALRLVALRIEDGSEKWSVDFDFSKCRHMLYLAAGGDTLIATGTDKDKTYHTFAFSTANGYKLWEHHAPAKKTHHSGHLGHPVVIDDRVFVNNHILERRSGEVLRVDDFDYHGCGVMSASRHTIFHRFEFHGMWDLESDKRTELLGIRSGCWLGMIPAGGLLLVPESSAGCSCTHSLQTSVAYVPAQLWR